LELASEPREFLFYPHAVRDCSLIARCWKKFL
jgi:hypothetical protein